MEEWVDISKDTRYQISTLSRIRNKRNGKIRKFSKSGDYLLFVVWKDGKYKGYLVHRLLAEAFIPIPEHLKHIPIDDLEVNHKNQNKSDNRIENLEWCNRIYNINFGDRTERAAKKNRNNRLSFSVDQYDKEGNFIAHYPSLMEAERITGVREGNISKVCSPSYKRKTAGGFIWKYSETQQNPNAGAIL